MKPSEALQIQDPGKDSKEEIEIGNSYVTALPSLFKTSQLVILQRLIPAQLLSAEFWQGIWPTVFILPSWMLEIICCNVKTGLQNRGPGAGVLDPLLTLTSFTTLPQA